MDQIRMISGSVSRLVATVIFRPFSLLLPVKLGMEPIPGGSLMGPIIWFSLNQGLSDCFGLIFTGMGLSRYSNYYHALIGFLWFLWPKY